jgi:hypothetical protein
MKHHKRSNTLLCALCIAVNLFCIGCGGGSSGTGEINSTGIVIDGTCRPVQDLPLDSLGVESMQTTTAADGSFEFKPDNQGTVSVPTTAQNESIKTPEPVCVVIQYEAGLIQEVFVYPAGSTDRCSLESILMSIPNAVDGRCG